MAAPGMAAPVLSVTVPRIVAVVPCAARRGATMALRKQPRVIGTNVFMRKPPDRSIDYATLCGESMARGGSVVKLWQCGWRYQESSPVSFGAGVTLWNQSSFTERMAAKYLSLSGGFTT